MISSLFDFFFILFPLGALALVFALRFFPLRLVFSFALLSTLGGVVVSLRSSILSVVGGGVIHASVDHSLRDSLRASTFSSHRPRGQSIRRGRCRCRDVRFPGLFPLLGDSRRLARRAASLAARLSRLGDAGGNRRARQRTRLLRRVRARGVRARLGARRDSLPPSRLARAQSRIVPARVLGDVPRARAERRARLRRRRRQPSVRHRRRRRDAARDDRHDDRERRRARDGEPEVRASTPRGRSRG